MTEPTTVPVTTYETTGETPDRTIIKSEDGEQVLLMTEIGPSSFVGSFTCGACGNKIAKCYCVAGPKAAPYVEVWRKEYTDGRATPAVVERDADDENAAEHQEAVVDAATAEKVDEALDAATAAATAAVAERDLSTIDVDF